MKNSLKYLSNFWRTLEILLISCEINLQLTCSKKGILGAGTAVNEIPIFTITDTKLYDPVVTLSIQDNIKKIKIIRIWF